MNSAFHPLMVAKRAARLLLSDQTIGMIDYIRARDRDSSLGGPFNGQPMRQALFCKIIAELRPGAIVETGTYLGTTTEFMAQSGLPVFTIELDARRYGYARARFRKRNNVTPIGGDSRTALCALFEGRLRDLAGGTLLFYLDAHWNEDLPLAKEIDIVFCRCPSAVVMIDDFQVPFDGGYGYDDYGPGKSLVPEYIAPTAAAHRLRAFYPATPSTEEGGARRGCIVLAREAVHGTALRSLSLLRPAETVPANAVA